MAVSADYCRRETIKCKTNNTKVIQKIAAKDPAATTAAEDARVLTTAVAAQDPPEEALDAI
jgi:hypothetical protein